MDNSYNIKIGKPFKNFNLEKLISFLDKNGITYDNKITYTIIISDSANNVIATGSLDHNIIKCVAVDNTHRNENLTSTLMTNLLNESINSGYDKLFIFTKVKNETIFKQFGFYTIEKTDKILLMENKKNGFNNYLKEIINNTKSFDIKENDKIGCIIANCNPFTNGHLYLITEAAKQCDFLHVFILSGNNDYFTEEERFQLVKKGLSKIQNIILHRAKEYILSPLTFPTYFLKDSIQTTSINCELDINIFLNKIAPTLNIKYRFVGTEPKDLVTNSYNQELINHLKDSPVELIILKRKEVNNTVISASTVRKFIDEKNINEIKNFVPNSTYEFIRSKFFTNLDSK
ncbi:MAG: [citrate (pro-3S)-lyase] ligase [Pleomorphochaeta sp.]